MKMIQWALAVIGSLALAVVAVGFFLPSQFEVKRSIDIKAPPAKVYDLVADPRVWQRWSEWNRRDPRMDMSFAGPPFGQGARWSWKSKSEGSGTMEFTRVEPNARIDYSLVFADFGMKSSGEFIFEPVAPGTRVTWTNRGNVGPNPLKHYLAMMMDGMVGPDFEKGLAGLKALAEKP
ncbi:MAG TPA: SRPBCC family protein [Usitatibacter sp.]|nr:SRPBCC family protein [Usitatibacter sp.]